MVAGHIYAKRTAWPVMRLRQAGTYTNHSIRGRKQTGSVTFTTLDYHMVLKGQERKPQTQKEPSVIPNHGFC